MSEPINDEARALIEEILGACSLEINTFNRRPEHDRLEGASAEVAREVALAVAPALSDANRCVTEILATTRHAYHTTAYQEASSRQLNLRSALQDAFKDKILPLLDPDLMTFVTLLIQSSGNDLGRNASLRVLPYADVVKAIEELANKNELSPCLQDLLWQLMPLFSRLEPQKEATKLRTRLENVLGVEPIMDLAAGEAWSDAALRFLESLSPAARKPWIRLLAHCQQAGSGKPTEKWLKQASTLLDAVGPAAFAAPVLEWVSLVEAPRTSPGRGYGSPEWEMGDANQQILKGLVQCVTLCDGGPFAKALTQAALAAYTKIPRFGPRAIRVGNACVWTLARIGNGELAALALLRVGVKARAGQKAVDEALTEISERTSTPREDLDELGVPAYGFEEVGVRQEQVGAFTATLVLKVRGKPALTFRSGDKTYKSTPAAVKQDHKEELADLKEVAEDAETMLRAQRTRLDGLFTARRAWPLQVWRERYLDHPLLGILSRRLIWSLRTGTELTPVFWSNGALVDVNGRTVAPSATAEVVPWHPLEAPPETVAAWQHFLETRELEQPFKQAHRETYPLTDAERTTRVYSNRFASHVVKQAQFNALCRERGWNTSARLNVDADLAPPTRDLPIWDLRAEFWVSSIGEDTNDVGSYLYLSTDQVRFYPRSAAKNEATAWGGGYVSRGADETVNRPVPLADVPPLVLSEVMRDIDLFVGVSSIGNDPTWLDGGEAVHHRDYWESYSFGPLSELAKTRRSALERLIPRLAIRELCEVTERFLVVKGKLSSYQIHIGSSSVRMLPSNQYLCIVRAPDAKAEPVYLPFEDDGRLTAILSKAMLLARDDRISDPNITSQIQRGLA